MFFDHPDLKTMYVYIYIYIYTHLKKILYVKLTDFNYPNKNV